MSDITVVIATFNRLALLNELLLNMELQSVVPEIIICDDGSGVSDRPYSLPPCVYKCIWSRDEGYNRVARYNEGVSLVRTPYVILLDDDCIPSTTWYIEEHLELLKEHDVVRGLFEHEGKFDLTPWFSSTNVSMRMDVAGKLGPFDIAYTGKYGYEDHDLGRSIERRCFTVVRGSEDTAVIHRGEQRHEYHTGLEENKRYYCEKWNIPYE